MLSQHPRPTLGLLAHSIQIFLLERNKFSPGSLAAANAKFACGLCAQSSIEQPWDKLSPPHH